MGLVNQKYPSVQTYRSNSTDGIESNRTVSVAQLMLPPDQSNNIDQGHRSIEWLSRRRSIVSIWPNLSIDVDWTIYYLRYMSSVEFDQLLW